MYCLSRLRAANGVVCLSVFVCVCVFVGHIQVVMTEGLPKGLVTNSEAITGDIQGVDHIDAEDLAHLWRGKRWRFWASWSIKLTVFFHSLHHQSKPARQRRRTPAGELFLEDMEQR